MPTEWCETTLGDVADFISGGTPSKARPEYWKGSVPWVSAKDMKQFTLHDTEDHVSDSAAASGTKLVPSGSVLLLTRGMTLLNDVPVCVIGRPMTFNQDVKALRPKAIIQGDYLPYLLLGNKPRLLSLVDLAGHGTGRLNTNELKALDVVIPPVSEQRAIARILRPLDDKIELNRRVSRTIETIARMLFKSWFVEFAPVRAKAEGRESSVPDESAELFPDSFEPSALGEIPKGWNVRPFREFVEHLREQEAPLSSPAVEFHHYSIPAFDAGHAPRIEYGREIKSVKWRVPPDAVLLSKLNPEIERVWLVDVRPGERSVSSTEFLVLEARRPLTRSFIYCLALSSLFRQQIESLVTGTSKSHQRAQVDSILNLPVVLPPAPLIAAFDRFAENLLARTLLLRRESATLAGIRDALLPKLTSGELRVRDAEQFVGSAA